MEQSGEQNANNTYAKAAVQSIRDNGLQFDPKTFAVWYEYHRGSNPGLRRVIDIILTNRNPVSAAAIDRIYDRFIADVADYRIVRETSQRMQESLAQLMALVEDANADAGKFGSTIRRVSGEFAANEVSIGGLVQTLLSEAKEIGERTSRMQAELTRNADLMQTMQQTLEDARREATTDPMTGLANRRSLDETLQSRAGTAMNDGMDLSLLMIDLDHFKKINDTWGHPVGDEVLKLAASTVRDNLRNGDLAARYGGEEFAVVLPGLDMESAALIGERVRKAFAESQVVLRSSSRSIGTITVSVGVAAYEPGESLGQWIKRADQALYEAKQGGRNRVSLAQLPAMVG